MNLLEGYWREGLVKGQLFITDYLARVAVSLCDEKWPTCGTCARAGKVCSGARNTFKFVVNGSHAESPNHAANATETSRLSLVSTGAGRTDRTDRTDRRRNGSGIVKFDPKQVSIGGCSSRRMGHYNSSTNVVMKPLPWSPRDQMAARLVTCLEAAPGTGKDLRILGPFLPMIPQHLGNGNTALDHAVELLLSAWMNSCRRLPSNMWLDLRTYNRAIRSLNDALSDANVELVTNTLAAQCVLQKTEVLYDFSRGSNQENHAAGLIAVINRRGPAQPMTEVVLHVMFESIYHMLQVDIRQDRESGFYTPEWMTALKEAIDASDIIFVLKQLYHLWVEVTAWPGLVRLVRSLRRNPLDIMTAAELHLRATYLAAFLQHQDETILTSLAQSGDIVEVENNTRPDLFSKCYKFANYPIAKLFTCHAFFSITVCRFLQEANRVLGHDDPSIEKQAIRSSRRVWMSWPWLQNQIPLAVDYTAALAFSYESGGSEERKYCIASLREMESFRHPPPIGEWVEATIMANAKAFTGRLPFLKTQDPKIEYDGIGCRS
ncbi:hypothetical protein HD806DRAFT_548106 [Xylariaceae sp. AK1471]|nr:hypothetical protein HD806DRAFT_548106 [Xylariaceae sp. AK1471]